MGQGVCGCHTVGVARLNEQGSDEQGAGRGRPRDETLTPRILRAARDELGEAGIEGFSVRRVAARSGVSRNAISSRWPTVDLLLQDTLGEIAMLHFEPTGHLRSDLRVLGEKFVAGLDSGALDIQLRVAADAKRHPDAFARMQARVLQPMSDALVATFDAAQRAGEVHDGDTAWLVRAFVGAILARTFQRPGRSAMSTADLDELIDHVVRWAAG